MFLEYSYDKYSYLIRKYPAPNTSTMKAFTTSINSEILNHCNLGN